METTETPKEVGHILYKLCPNISKNTEIAKHKLKPLMLKANK